MKRSEIRRDNVLNGYRVVKADVREMPEIIRFVYRDRKIIVVNTAANEDAKNIKTIHSRCM